jgi:hypothetical protein
MPPSGTRTWPTALAAWLWNYDHKFRSLNTDQAQQTYVEELVAQLDTDEHRALVPTDWNKWSTKEKTEVCPAIYT